MYRGSLFLPSKRVPSMLRTVFAKSGMQGHVNGTLGQNHLDVLEACFVNQLHLTTSAQVVKFANPDGTESESLVNTTGIVFDPYRVRKSLRGRMNNDRIFRYLNEIMNTKLKVIFTPPKANVMVMANTPMIVGFENFKEIQTPHDGESRHLKSIYFPQWFVDLCKMTPYFQHNVAFFDIPNPEEKAIKRFLLDYPVFY